MTCAGLLIVHADGTNVGCTLDDEPEGYAGREERHDGSPPRCIAWWDCCDYCGIQSATG